MNGPPSAISPRAKRSSMKAACSGHRGCSRAPFPGSQSEPAGRSTTKRRSVMEALSPMLELETPRGPARVHVQPARDAWAALVLGHGAGGGIGAPDLVAAADAAREASVAVALVEQPYRVAGRRPPAPAAQLDEVWISVLEQLRAGELSGLP